MTLRSLLFVPGDSDRKLARAHRVVAAFAASDAGVPMLDGRMLDRPHLLQAQRVIAAASR